MNLCLSVKKVPDLRHGFLTLPRFSLLCHGGNSYSNTKAEGVGFGQQHESLRLTLSQGPVLHLLKLQLKPTLQRAEELCACSHAGPMAYAQPCYHHHCQQ